MVRVRRDTWRERDLAQLPDTEGVAVKDLEIVGPAAARVRLDGGPCDGHHLVLLDLILAVVATRDHPENKWMVHEYFTGDRPELVAHEAAYYRRVGDKSFMFVGDMLAVSHLDGHPHWSLAPVPAVAAP